MENQNVIYGINGPVVTVKGTRSFSMMEMVYVGEERLLAKSSVLTIGSPPSRYTKKPPVYVLENRFLEPAAP